MLPHQVGLRRLEIRGISGYVSVAVHELLLDLEERVDGLHLLMFFKKLVHDAALGNRLSIFSRLFKPLL